MAERSWKQIVTGAIVVDRAGYQNRRREFLRRYVDFAGKRGLEFGGFDLPTVTPEMGDCAIADMRSECHLAKEFEIPLETICPVDCIVEPGLAAHRQIGLRFDYVILCHVLEHIPDVITMMNDLSELLVPGGTLFIALPDKRQTPDAPRNSTTLPRLIERQLEGTNTPSLAEIAEFSLAWNDDFKTQYRESLQDFFHGMRSHQLFGDPDVHCNVWRDDEFIEQVQELIRGDYLPDLEIIATQATQSPFNEFYVALRRPPHGSSSGGEADRRNEPAVFYRSCNFCGFGQFKVWKRIHAPFPERLYSDSVPDTRIGRALSLQYLTCRHCDLTTVNPMPEFDVIDRHQFGAENALDLREDELDSLIENRRQVTRIISEQYEFESYRQTGNLLDVSCGPGIGLAWLRDERGWNVSGVEPAREFVRFARDRFGLELVNGLVQDLTDPNGSFDVIVIDSSLQCMFDPLGTLIACHRLLRDGGCLCIQVPNRDGLGTEWLDQNVHWGHWFSYTPAVLHRILERIGFQTERILSVQSAIDPRVASRFPDDFAVPAEELDVRLHGAMETNRYLDAGNNPRADFFGISARKLAAHERDDASAPSLETLREISSASRRQRYCVAIDPDTDVLWPWDRDAVAENGEAEDTSPSGDAT